MLTMQKSTSHRVKPLASAILLACLISSNAVAQSTTAATKTASDKVAKSPFAYLSLNLQNLTVPGQGGKAPTNIMLYIDDSGSMTSFVRDQNAVCEPGFTKLEPRDLRWGGHKVYTPRLCYKKDKLDQLLKGFRCSSGHDVIGVYNPNNGNLAPDTKFVSGNAAVHPAGYPNYKFTAGCVTGAQTIASTYKYLPLDRQGKDKDYYYLDTVRRLDAVKYALTAPGSNGEPEGVLTKYAKVDGDKGNIRWSLRTLWGNETSPKRSDDGSRYIGGGWGGVSHPFTSNYSYIIDLVKSTKAAGATPATREYLLAAEHLINKIEYVCQQNYIVMLSDGDPNSEEDKDSLSKSWYSNGTYPNANFYGRVASNYRYDGLNCKTNWQGIQTCTAATPVNNHGISLFSRKLAQGDIKTGTGDRDGLGWDNPDFPPQTIKTYTIGFGGGISSYGQAYLKAAQTEDIDYDNVNVLTVEQLVDAFDKIFKDIDSKIKDGDLANQKGNSASSPAITPAVNNNYANLGINLKLDTANWSSTLEFVEVDGSKVSAGSVKRYVHFPEARRVIINDGNRNYLVTSGQINSADKDAVRRAFNFEATQAKEFENSFMPWYLRSAAKTDEQISLEAKTNTPFAELRRVQSYRQRTAGATDVSRMMGDVMDAPLLAMERNEDREARKSSGGYQKYLVTAANDGMVYIFKAQQNTNSPYSLELNYLPAGIERESATDTIGNAIAATAEEKYGRTVTADQADGSNQPHLYLNNGGLQWRETAPDANGKTALYLAGTVGQGGRGAYVLALGGYDRGTSTRIGLDVAESNWANSVPLWETEKGANNKLGYTISTPQFAQTATKYTVPDPAQPNVKKADFTTGVRQLMFLANGYAPGLGSGAYLRYDQKPMLYVYDALGQEMSKNTTVAVTSGDVRGSKITTIEMPKGFGGLSSPVLVDTDGDYMADHAYAGDRGGNVYRITLRGAPKEWTAHKIYEGVKATVMSGNKAEERPTQPISAKPAVHRVSSTKYVVLVGTGSDVYQSDLIDKSRQVFLGLFDNLENTSPSTVKQGDLVKQEITEMKVGQNNTYRFVSQNPVKDINEGATGWYLELGPKTSPDGERVVTSATVLNGAVFFTSRVYQTSQSDSSNTSGGRPKFSCKTSEVKITSNAVSWIYALDAANGQASTGAKATLESFGGENNSSGSGSQSGGDGKGAAGLQLSGVASAVVLTSITEMREQGVVSVDNSGGFKEGSDLQASDVGTDTRSSTCYHYSDVTASVVDESGLKVFDVLANLCPPGRFIRINSRPILQRLY